MKRWFYLVGVLAFLAGCSQRVAALTMQLHPGMQQDQVIAIMGHPDKTSETTCGSQSANGAWSCQIWEYDELSGNTVLVYFGQSTDGTWTLNNYTTE
jgi:hypothetical protein